MNPNKSTVAIPSLREATAHVVRLLRLARQYWNGMAAGWFLSFTGGILGLVAPYAAKLYFDTVYPNRDFSLLHVLVLGVAAFAVASALIGALRTFYAQTLSAKLGSAVGLMYFNHVQHLPMRFFVAHRVGEIMSRNADMRSAIGMVARLMETLLVSSMYLVLVPPFLLSLNWELTVIALITTPLSTIIATVTSRAARQHMKAAAEAGAELSASQVEAFNHIRTLKAMGLEPAVFRNVKTQAEQTLRLQLNAAAVTTLVRMGNTVVRAAGMAVFTWYAWTLILKGALSLGSFVAFSAYLGYLVGPVGQVTELFADFQLMSVTLGRAFEYLDQPPEQNPQHAYGGTCNVRNSIRGPLTLDSVCFGYTLAKPVLNNVSVEFARGSVTAIVGASGAGKSTILRLLCRMERPWAGAITVDGVPLDRVALRDLRRQIGIVWQEPAMLRGSIWDNLTFGVSDPSQTDIDAAVRACRLDKLIRDLPNGYSTMIAEWGATLSGGQMQRFALARALLRRPPILLLDETTSQVDVRTEAELLREVLPCFRDKTVVMVTHRVLTASIADRICVLADGRLLDAGTHEELLGDSDVYREMVQSAHGHGHGPVQMLGRT